MKAMQGVAVLGSLSLDTNLTEHRSLRKLGGAITYSGLTFSRLGVPTTVVFNLASTDRPVCRLFEAENVRTAVGHTETTTRFVNDIRGKSRKQSAPALAEPIRAEDVRLALGQVAHIHLGPLHWDDIDAHVFTEDFMQLLITSADVQGFMRRPDEGQIVAEVSPHLADVFRVCSHVKASRREMERLTAHLGLSPLDLIRSFDLEEIVVTEDRTGGVVFSKTGTETRYRAEAKDSEVIDTTGAGDVFFAAYLAHRIHRGDSIATSSQRAAEVASLQVRNQFIAEETLLLNRYLPSDES